MKWRELVVAWAKNRYGKHLLGVYEHTDEANGHIHIHIHILFANKGRNVKPIMSGPSAAKAKLAEGGTPAQAQEALIEANKKFQMSSILKSGNTASGDWGPIRSQEKATSKPSGIRATTMRRISWPSRSSG